MKVSNLESNLIIIDIVLIITYPTVACIEGEYKSLQGVDDKCIVCPENSNSTSVGALSCDCLDGYYRVENNMVDTRCTIGE